MTWTMIAILWTLLLVLFLFGFYRFMSHVSGGNIEQMKEDIIDMRVTANHLRVQARRAADAATRDSLINQAADLESRAEAMTRKVFG